MAQQVTITLNLNTLKKSVANELYKWGEANREDANYQRIYELQYSSSDSVDSSLLTLYVKQRTDRIADMVSEYLTSFGYSTDSENNTRASTSTDTPDTPDTPTPQSETATFAMTLPAGWNNSTFASLAKLFEDYVINGAAADWFVNAGVEQGKVCNAKASECAIGIQRNIYHKNSTIS